MTLAQHRNLLKDSRENSLLTMLEERNIQNELIYCRNTHSDGMIGIIVLIFQDEKHMQRQTQILLLFKRGQI